LSNHKSHNSILVLATLGVYLGLVLVGATPQVLAQAAMTKQFNVKDEIEVKDDLEKKPDNATADIGQTAASESDHKITRSVERFLARLKTVDSVNSLCMSPEPGFECESRWGQTGRTDRPGVSVAHAPIDQILVVTNLPRAGLYTLLAKDVK